MLYAAVDIGDCHGGIRNYGAAWVCYTALHRRSLRERYSRGQCQRERGYAVILNKTLMHDLSYPIGKFQYDQPLTGQGRHECIDQIAQAPSKLREAVAGLTDAQLDTPYRPGGWTVRQVVHHLPDSHMTSYARFRLALTEDQPAIKGYYEDRWAELPDARTAPVELSLTLLEAVHKRWVLLLQSLTPEQMERTFRHSEMGLVPLHKNIALYAWHGRHHVAQITSLRQRMKW